MNKTKRIRIIRYCLGSLLLIMAVNAFGGGWYGMTGAEALPLEWLSGSPFRDYFIPSLILFVVIGGSAATAGMMIWRQNRFGIFAAILCSTIVFIWLTVQVSIIGYVSWMQPATAIVNLIILLLSVWVRKLSSSDVYAYGMR